jgi:hypothetical protein
MECKSSFQIWSGCDASKCTSPDGEGGYDCIAGGKWEEYPSGEPLTCKAGYIVRKTKDFGEWQAYTCCTEEEAERSTIKGADTAVKTGRSERPALLVVWAGIGLVSYKLKPYVYAVFAADIQTRVNLYIRASCGCVCLALPNNPSLHEH